jgi:hypothetical protein
VFKFVCLQLIDIVEELNRALYRARVLLHKLALLFFFLLELLVSLITCLALVFGGPTSSMFSRNSPEDVEVILNNLETGHLVQGLHVVAGNHTDFMVLDNFIEHFVSVFVV